MHVTKAQPSKAAGDALKHQQQRQKQKYARALPPQLWDDKEFADTLSQLCGLK